MKKLLLIVGIIFLFACTKETAEDLFPAPPPISDTTAVSFMRDIRPILSQHCSTPGCHTPTGRGNGLFDNYINTKMKVDNGSFRNRVVVVKDMPEPPAPPLSQAQINLIQTWLDRGALNN